MTEKLIITPGDPGWDSPRVGEDTIPGKLPSSVLEAAFTEVVKDAQTALDASRPAGEADAVEPVPVDTSAPASSVGQAPTPGPSFKYHRPAVTKVYDVKAPQPVMAELQENLPRKWEEVCYRKFRKGMQVTITGFSLFPGIGSRYIFAEGARGSYCLREDQIKMLLPNPEVKANDAVDGQGTEVQPARATDQPESQG